jgi:hypothetical protein
MRDQGTLSRVDHHGDSCSEKEDCPIRGAQAQEGKWGTRCSKRAGTSCRSIPSRGRGSWPLLVGRCAPYMFLTWGGLFGGFSECAQVSSRGQTPKATRGTEKGWWCVDIVQMEGSPPDLPPRSRRYTRYILHVFLYADRRPQDRGTKGLVSLSLSISRSPSQNATLHFAVLVVESHSGSVPRELTLPSEIVCYGKDPD